MYLGIALGGAALFAIAVLLWLIAGAFHTETARDRAHAIAVGVAAFGLIGAIIGVIASLVTLSS